MKQVEPSTDRNPPPIFTKLSIKVEFRDYWEMWLHIVLVEVRKAHVRQTGNGINFQFTVAPIEK